MKQSYKWIKIAHDRGYRIRDGKCYNPDNKEIGYCSIDQPYKRFGLVHEGKRRDIFFHRLVAYQLYGEDAFKLNVCIRHLDDNSLNNLEHNIGLGTHLDNAYDISPEKRSQRSLTAIQTRKRLAEGLDQTIIQEHKMGTTTNEISRKYGVVISTIRNVIKKNLY